MIRLFPERAVAIELFGFGVHWYGLLYLAGFLVAAWLLPILGKRRDLPLRRDDWMQLLSWAVVGVIGGGRLGYVLFYEPAYFLSNPARIMALWEGGMSFHGGLLGVLLVTWLFCRRHRVDFFRLGDVIVVPVAIGLALGRLGNFLNQELYGTITTLPWGMRFDGAEGLRHPTQLYAVAKDLFIAAACYLHLRRTTGGARGGRTGALFLMLYGVGRFLVEFLRVPTAEPFVLGPIALTRGQLLTIPVFLAGAAAWFLASRQTSSSSKGNS